MPEQNPATRRSIGKLIAELEATTRQLKLTPEGAAAAVPITDACTNVAGCVTTTCEVGCQDVALASKE
jgi:hypothetical protein